MAIKEKNKGVPMDNEKLSITAYADDIAIIATTAEELQSLLNTLEKWCIDNQMKVNTSKTQVVHFRRPCKAKTQKLIQYGQNNIEIVREYKYLGLYLTEFMDMNYTAKQVAKAANRSLGLLITKSKLLGGMAFDCFTKLYNALVDSIIQYGSTICGYRAFSCINAVQNRAGRFF